MQNKAIDVVIRANDPDTIKYLIAVLKDENEYARRAAVEVLNEVGNAKSVKYLLEAIKDDDWWVRSRAADALGKIGGPKVIDAVLQLVRDQDEDIRRAADRDPQPDQGRARRRPPHRGHQGQGLVGQRTRRRCAGRNRQQARRAAPDGDARDHAAALAAGGGARPGPARRLQGHRRGAAHAARATRRKSASRPSPRWPNSPTNAGSKHIRVQIQAQTTQPNRPSRRRRCARCPSSTRASR